MGDTIYMIPVPALTGVITMDPLPELTGIIYMTPEGEGGGGGGGGGEASIVWTFKGYTSFVGKRDTSATWNMTPGDFSMATTGNPVLHYPGYKYAKCVAMSGYLDPYWTNSGGTKVYTMQFKSTIDSGSLGQTITLGAGGALLKGYLDAVPAATSGAMGYGFYLGK
jgi:hypothetical protein